MMSRHHLNLLNSVRRVVKFCISTGRICWLAGFHLLFFFLCFLVGNWELSGIEGVEILLNQNDLKICWGSTLFFSFTLNSMAHSKKQSYRTRKVIYNSS